MSAPLESLNDLQALVKRCHRLDEEARELFLQNTSTAMILRYHIEQSEKSIADERARQHRQREAAKQATFDDAKLREFFAPGPAKCEQIDYDTGYYRAEDRTVFFDLLK